MPWRLRVVSTCCCAAAACEVHDRSCASVAKRTYRSRSATEGVWSTTIDRWPVNTCARSPPTRPLHASGEILFAGSRPPADMLTTSAVATAPARTTRDGRLRRGTRIERKVVGVRDGIGVARGGGDHRGVVGAELKRRKRGFRESRAQLGVRRDAADDGDLSFRRGPDAFDQRAHDRPLVRGGEIRTPLRELGGRHAADAVEQRRLQAREREVEPGHACDRKVVRGWIALRRERIDLLPTRVAEAEQPRTLVERLSRGVVEGRAE